MIAPKDLLDVMEAIKKQEEQARTQFYEKYGDGAQMIAHPDFWREVALRDIPEWLIPTPPSYIKLSENVPYGKIFVLRPFDPMQPSFLRCA